MAYTQIQKWGFKESLKPDEKWGPSKDDDRMAFNSFRDDDVVYHWEGFWLRI